MIEKIFPYTFSDSKSIEKIVQEVPVAINHVILYSGDAVPEHYTNSNVYLIIVKGNITLKLNEQEIITYNSGNIINIPFNTKMVITNTSDDLLEFFIVKAPSQMNL